MSEIKTYTQMRRDFYEKYQKYIVPAVKKYDKERVTKLWTAIVFAILLSIAGAFLLYNTLVSELDSDSKEAGIKASVFLFALAIIQWNCIKKNFENNIKTKIMPTVCSCFENLAWTCKIYPLGRLFEQACVVPRFTSEYYDDIFKGLHKEVSIEIAEARYIRGCGKNRKTVFSGVIVKLDMNKNFTSHTIITPDTLLHHAPQKNLKHTILEDVEFEKKFDVFTNDEVEARYLITPSFMQRLKAIETAFQADKVTCSFYGKNLFIALHTNKDIFSLCSLVKPMDYAQQYFQMYEEMVSIIKLIDHFKLDQKIGL